MATIVNWVFILGTKLLLAYIRGQLQRALCIIPEDPNCLLCPKHYMNYPSNLIMESYLDTHVSCCGSTIFSGCVRDTDGNSINIW